MKVGIHQPNFMPWAGYIRKIYESDKFVFLDNVKCSKNSFFNRNRFSSDKHFNNNFWLSCPISKESYRKNLLEVEASTQFINKHIRYFKTRHGKSEESEFLEEIIALYAVFQKEDDINLVKFNCAFISLISKYLNLETEFFKASDIVLESNLKKENLVIQIVKELGGNTYISGHGAKNYQNISSFEIEGIDLLYIDEEFHNIKTIKNQHLSIVDLMLHEGIWKIRKMILH